MSDNLCRDEQYKQMWAELENLIRAHADSSPQHQKVLECLLKCKKPSDDVKSSPSSTKEEKQETNTDQNYAWKELDRSGVKVQCLCICNLWWKCIWNL